MITNKLTVSYDGGDALRDSGGGNFILIPRSTWYPNNGGTQFGDRAIFDVTFRHPKNMTFVGTGANVGTDTREGDLSVTRWSSGTTELAVAGFNYGRFKKKEFADKETGYNIEFYANEEVPDELKQIQMAIDQAEREGKDQRKRILEATPFTKHRKPYTVGPVTQGYRLNSGKTGGVAQNLIYPKGAYILHMIRMMMYEQRNGDAKFQAMMKDS